jgi:hypothetical protein
MNKKKSKSRTIKIERSYFNTNHEQANRKQEQTKITIMPTHQDWELRLKTPKAATVKGLKGSKVRVFSEEEVATVKIVQRNMRWRRRRFVTVKKKRVQSRRWRRKVRFKFFLKEGIIYKKKGRIILIFFKRFDFKKN